MFICMQQKILVERSDVSCLGMGTRFKECYMPEFGWCQKVVMYNRVHYLKKNTALLIISLTI